MQKRMRKHAELGWALDPGIFLSFQNSLLSTTVGMSSSTLTVGEPSCFGCQSDATEQTFLKVKCEWGINGFYFK